MDSITKICTKCKEEKTLDLFYRQKGCYDGRRPECKKCSNLRIDRCHKDKPELKKLWSKTSRERNKDREKATKKKYFEKNKEIIIQKRKLKYLERKEYHKNKSHEWYLNNKDKVMTKLRERKAKMLGAGGRFTEKDWLEVLHRYGNSCLRCGSKEKIVRDHVVPVSRGGVNTKYNIQPLCSKCNLEKFTQSWDFRFDKGKWNEPNN